MYGEGEIYEPSGSPAEIIGLTSVEKIRTPCK
jgi:hypothetical protein